MDTTTAPDPAAVKQQVTGVFNLVANGYDSPAQRFFPFCADRLAARLAPRPGARILDVATGTGAVATALAQRVAPQGRVHGIDLAEAMLARAAANAKKMGLDNIDLHVMDAEALEFRSHYFDAVTCSFGLFFLPDMLAGLKEWKRVLRPGARVIFTTFTAQAFSPMSQLFRARLEGMGIEIPPARWQRLCEPLECETLLHAAGFTDIECTIEQMGYHLRDAQDWWELVWNTGFRGMVERLAPAQQATFRDAHLDEVTRLVTEQGLWLNVETIFSSARAP